MSLNLPHLTRQDSSQHMFKLPRSRGRKAPRALNFMPIATSTAKQPTRSLHAQAYSTCRQTRNFSYSRVRDGHVGAAEDTQIAEGGCVRDRALATS